MTNPLLLKDVTDPPHCPDWAIGPLKFQQNVRLKHSPGFDAEATVIKHFYDVNGCDTLIDVGCWLGVLALKNYMLIQPKKMILVDAIPMYLRMCRELFKSHNLIENIWALPMCIVPEPEKFNDHFLIDLSNTVSTSNVLPKNDIMKDRIRVNIPTYKPAVTPQKAAEVLSTLITNKTYLKIDIDTIDYDLVMGLLKLVKPTTMNFECMIYNDHLKSKFFKTVEFLKTNGYALPDLTTLDLSKYDFIDLFVSNNEWAIMTYYGANTPAGTHGVVYEKTITSY